MELQLRGEGSCWDGEFSIARVGPSSGMWIRGEEGGAMRLGGEVGISHGGFRRLISQQHVPQLCAWL